MLLVSGVFEIPGIYLEEFTGDLQEKDRAISGLKLNQNPFFHWNGRNFAFYENDKFRGTLF